MRLDLMGLGSAIIDFAPANTGVPLSKVRAFIPFAGGAVANILVAASRLGLRTGFLGCIGDDEFGAFLMRDFEREGVDTSCVKRVRDWATGLAFYSVDERGERHYVFYRVPGHSDPETTLKPEDIKPEYIAQCKVLHFSEALLRCKETRNTVFKALSVAKENGVMISYDPNMRMELWPSREEIIETQREVLRVVDVFLATLREAKLIIGKESAEEVADSICALGPSTVVIRESDRYRIATRARTLTLPIFKAKAVDSSGAGDAFDAGFLTGVIKDWSLDKAVLLGSAVAALKVLKVGTRAGLPSMEEAVRFIRKRTGTNHSRSPHVT